MTRNNQVARAVRRALVMGAVTAAGTSMPVLAQDQQEQGGETVTTVVVTGSRIAQKNLTTTSPVTQLTSKDIATQGVTRVEDLVTQLPQAFASQNATVSNGATGAATVDLRHLGSARTLVLIDGRRMPYGSIFSSASDLNLVPTAMVERVEVLTGGSSAVYGSDAVAGVVNFIMKKDFEGVQIDAQYSFYQHHNSFSGPGSPGLRDVIAANASLNVIPSTFALPDSNVTDGYGREGSILVGVGTDDRRGNITLYAGYRDNGEVLQANRDYSACSLNANPVGAYSCGGSSTIPLGRFATFGGAAAGFPNFSLTLDPANPGTFRPYVGSRDQYNYGPTNFYQRPDTRYNLGAFGHFELNEHADVYSQLMYSDYRTLAQIAPGGDFFNSGTINCDNPLMSDAQATTIGCTAAMRAGTAANNSLLMYIGRRNVEGGGRQYDFHTSGFRGVVGVKGSISSGWDYDVSSQYSRTAMDNTILNNFSSPNLINALNVVDVGGVPTCVSVVNGTDPNCVPYNVFSIGGVTQAALNYLQVPSLTTAIIGQSVTQGVITGDLTDAGWKLPSASEGVKLVFGVEGRHDTVNFQPDYLTANGLLAGSGGPTPPLNGSTNVVDYFMEGNVPLVQDKAFAQQMSVDVAYRYSDYGSGLTTNTYKFGADWAPVEDIRFRGSFQRAVRAPNVIELFTAQGFNLFDLGGDPCGAAAPNPNATLAKCVASGVPAASYHSAALDSPAGQYNFLQGGNLDLQPEKSDTVSFGIVLTPRAVRGMSLTVDWFNIKIDGTISTFGSQNTLDACYNNDDAAACARIHRTAGGLLWVGTGHVDDLNINIGGLKTSGVDTNFLWSGISLGAAGKLSVSLNGTYLSKFDQDPGPGLGEISCAGLYAAPCGVKIPNPKWRHSMRFGWTTPWKGIDLALTWRYFSSVDLYQGNATHLDFKLGSQSYLDLAGSWAITDKIDARVGVNNLLDRDPPLSGSVGTTGNGNTYPQTYDALGRYVFGSMSVKF
jgi:iron complex outermembrane receptor protein